MKYLLLILILFIFYKGQTQEDKKTNTFGVSDDVKIDNAPKYYSSYFSEYYINENWNLRVEMQQLNFMNSFESNSVLDIPFLAKYKLSDKWGFLFGPKIRLFKGNMGAVENLELLSTFRIQYDVNEKLSLEAGVDFNLKSSNSQNNYNLDDGMIYKFGGRFKF